MAASLRAFAPSLGPLIASLAQRPWTSLQDDPPELARFAIQALQVAGGTHLVCPIDRQAVTAACSTGAELADGELDLSKAGLSELDDLEPEDLLASRWIQPMIELARIAATQARVPVAARLPSPLRLVADLGGDPDDRDSLLAAADICSAVALGLLRAGASLAIVDPIDDAPGDASVAMLARTAAPFGVPVLDTSSESVRWIHPPLSGGDDAPAISRAGDLVLITSRPVRWTDDLGRLRELAVAVTG